ncbi:MAG: hypothetical protein HKN39_07435 [Flavobacteriales bacterium]|nr:hypothetical protein [Flavobacteriales bacterium]
MKVSIHGEQIEEKKRSFKPFKWYVRQFKERGTWGKIFFGLLPFLLLYGIIAGRGDYQPLLVYVRIYWPLIIISLLIIYFFYRRFKKASEWYARGIWIAVFALFCLFIYQFGNGIYNYISSYYVYKNRVTIIELDKPPISIHPKLQPQFVVESYFQETMNNNRQPTSPRTWLDPVTGEQYWTGWTEPGNYFFQQFGGKVEEFIHTNVQNPAPVLDQYEREPVDFQVGNNLIFSYNIQKAARKKLSLLQMFNSEVSDMVIGMKDNKGKLYQVVPILTWKGFLFPQPSFGGVMIFDNSTTPYLELVFAGKGKFLNADEVKATPWLKEQALLDDKTVFYFGESLRFKYGFTSGLPGNHENDHRIPQLKNAFSSLPVIEQFNFEKTGSPQAGSGLFYWLELEPYDSTKYGLSMDVFIPGSNTDTIYVYDRVDNIERSGYKGMSVVVEKIMEDDKSYNWVGGKEGGTFIPGGERPYYTYVFPDDPEPEMFYLANILTVRGQNRESTSTKAELYLIHAKYDDIIILLKGEDVYPERWLPKIQQRVITQRKLMRRDMQGQEGILNESTEPIQLNESDSLLTTDSLSQ